MTIAESIEAINTNTTKVDLSNNNLSLEDARALAAALEGCKNLVHLNLHDNKFGPDGTKAVAKALEGSKNLTILSLQNNNMGPEGAKAFAKVLEASNNLTNVFLGGNDVRAEGVTAFAKALGSCNNLTVLGLRNNNIGAKGTKSLAKALKSCKKLTRLGIGGNNIGSEGIFYLVEALESCTNLKELNLGGNDIGAEGIISLAKPLEGLKNLTRLNLEDNHFGFLGTKALVKLLDGCCNLTALNLQNNNIGPKGAETLAMGFGGCKNLVMLSLRYNNICATGAKAIAKALEGCHSLIGLHLEATNIRGEGAKALANALEGCIELQELRLQFNKIGDEGAKAFAKVLEGCTNLITLGLDNNDIGDEGAKAIAKALNGCTTLTTLSLAANNIGDGGAKSFAKALQGCTTLTTLSLDKNNIGCKGAEAFGLALDGCTTLTTLSLDANNIGEGGAKAFAKALCGCTTLTTMSLMGNEIGVEAAKVLANALEGCTNLTKLNLHNNGIGDGGVKAFAKVLQGCKNLIFLDLGFNAIGNLGAKSLAESLEDCTNLTMLNLQYNNIRIQGAKALAKALENCKKLTRLNFRHNKICMGGAKALAKALENCSKLTELNLEDNDIGDEGARALAKALEVCEDLFELNIGSNRIGAAGIEAVSKALNSCMGLVTLDLHSNNFGDAGAKALINTLEYCNELVLLHIWDNHISVGVLKSLHKAFPSVGIRYKEPFSTNAAHENLFEEVYSSAEDIGSSDTESSDPDSSVIIIDEAPRTSAVSESNEDIEVPEDLRDPDKSAKNPEITSVKFGNVVQLAEKVSDLRMGLGKVGEESQHIGIELLEEFLAPAIKGYFGQIKMQKASNDIFSSIKRLETLQSQIRETVHSGLPRYVEDQSIDLGPTKLRKTSGDVKNAKERLENLQSQASRESCQDDLLSLIKQRNAEREHLRSLVEDTQTWVHAKLPENDEDGVHKFKVKLTSVLDHLAINFGAQDTCTDDFQSYQELATQAGKCVEDYRLRLNQKGRSAEQRSKQAVERVIERVAELGLGDAFCVVLRSPEKASELKLELIELQNALQEELGLLKEHTLHAKEQSVLRTIGSAFHRVENLAEGIELNENTNTLEPDVLAELYDYVRLGSTEPNVSNMEQLQKKLETSRKAMEGLRRAKESLNEASSEKKREFYRDEITEQEGILSKGTPVELSKIYRHKLAETLQHAQEHYPELVKDQVWLERLHVSTDGVFEVACSDLWLANVNISDFQPVGRPLAFRGGKTVQKVLDNDGKTLVLKQFQLGHISQSKTFYKQVANLGKVTSQHVIRITGAFIDTSHGLPRGCIVMPFYEQGDLAKWIQEHPNEGKAARDRLATGLLIDVADIHDHGIVHCDIKPENIFLTSNGTPLLGDFDGIKVANYTATFTSLQATPRYIAPELKNGPVEKFQTAMDMYSVGVVLEELYPELTSAMQQLIETLKARNPNQRLSAHEALQHEAFGVSEAPTGVCLVCQVANPLSKSTSCERGHFLCQDCIARSVEAAAQPDASVTVDADGTMACMNPGCDGRITGQEITRLAPNALNHLLRIAQMKVESEAAVRAEQEIQRRMAEVIQTDGLTRDAQMHLRYIQEKILNAYCPNCNACFDKFEGCCAVKCGNPACGHHFCAWCLEYSSEDSESCHEHVRNCSRRLGQDPFYPDSFEQVRKAWRVLRGERLCKYWTENIQDKSLPSILGAQLLPLLTPDVIGRRFRLDGLR